VNRSKTRPAPVTFISLYHFCAAIFLLVILLVTAFDPDSHFNSNLAVQVTTYLITRHNIVSRGSIPILMPAIAGYLAIVGWGLWCLQAWARRLVIATSGLTVLSWLRALLIRQWTLGESLFRDELARQTVYVLMAINSIIFCCLTLYPDVVQAFEGGRE
jgi:hypothetical protein